MVYSAPIKIVDIGADMYRIDTCSTFHVTDCRTVTIGGIDYAVESWINNQSFVIEANPAPVGDTFNIAPPFFYVGTPDRMNSEKQQRSELNNLPFVWLYQTYDEDVVDEVDSLIDYYVTVRMFFLDTFNVADNLIDDNITKVVTPMRNLAEAYRKKLDRSKDIGKLERVSFTPHIDFGVFIKDRGHLQSIFDGNYAGTELSVRIPVLKAAECCQIC